LLYKNTPDTHKNFNCTAIGVGWLELVKLWCTLQAVASGHSNWSWLVRAR